MMIGASPFIAAHDAADISDVAPCTSKTYADAGAFYATRRQWLLTRYYQETLRRIIRHCYSRHTGATAVIFLITAKTRSHIIVIFREGGSPYRAAQNASATYIFFAFGL